MGTSAMTEVAYYYPQPYWRMSEGDWLKSLLLFFDRIAILLPRYMHGVEVAADPVLAGPMEQRGLLQILSPETFVNQAMTEQLAVTMTGLISAGAFDDLEKTSYFQELSHSRMGWDADVQIAKDVITQLMQRGLARKSEDGVSVPLHPVVRKTVLVLLSQLARARGRELGLELHPVTGDPTAMQALLEVLSLPTLPSAGQIVALDLETVGVDLSAVPLDEVVSFREDLGAEYRAYARDVRQLVAQLSPMARDDRDRLLMDRREELADRAHDLRRLSTKTWRQPLASIGFGVAGAAWQASQGDLVSAGLSLGAGFVGAALMSVNSGMGVNSGAYSYLFRVRDSISAPPIGTG